MDKFIIGMNGCQREALSIYVSFSFVFPLQRSQSSKDSGLHNDDEEKSIMMSDSVLDIGSYAKKFADVGRSLSVK